MSFLSDIEAFREKALQQASKNSSDVFEYVSKQAVLLSPTPPGKSGIYATGHLKDQWYASINSPDKSTGSSASIDGASSIGRIDSLLSTQPFYGKDATLYITNSVHYAYLVDKLGWKAGLDIASGWIWTGNAKPYAITETAIAKTLLRYKV